MKLQPKNSINFTFIVAVFVHKTGDIPLYQTVGGGAHLFLNAQYFRFVSAC